METRKGLKYSKTHEWIEIDGNTAKIGITDFAQHSLGDIVYVELPNVGEKITMDSDFGIVESVKAVSDLNAPLSGKVISTNLKLEDKPEVLNGSPYDNWIVEIEISDMDELTTLMDESDYITFCEQEE